MASGTLANSPRAAISHADMAVPPEAVSRPTTPLAAARLASVAGAIG